MKVNTNEKFELLFNKNGHMHIYIYIYVYMYDMGILYLRHACEYIWQIVSNKEKHKGENSSNDGCMIEKYDLILQWLAT